jgi:PAS domain S-box-containing protein
MMTRDAKSPGVEDIHHKRWDAIADAALVADAESRYLDANPAALRLLGYTLAELRTMSVSDVVAHGPEWTAAEYEQFVRDGRWEGRLVVRNRNQALIVVDARATSVRLADRTEYVSVLRERQTPAAGLVRPKAKILVVDDEPANRKLLAGLVAHEGYEVVTAAGGAEALAILDSAPIDLVLLDLMMPEVDGMSVLSELQKRQLLPALPVVVVTAHEERKVRIDALTAGAIDFIAKPIDRLEVACRIRTLVELRQLRETAVATVESKLRESDHLLRLHFDQLPVAKIAWDTSFRVVTWNRAAEKLFGYTSAEALGQHAAFIVPESERVQADAIWRELLGGRANESTHASLAKDGRTLQCEWHNAPLTSADGAFLGVCSVILDVTERARLQSALAQSQKMDAVGQLAGGVAHDFNNILAVILSYGTFVRDALPQGDERRDDIVEVLNAADRAAGLTRQLLTFTRQQPTEKRPTDLNRSLAQVHKLLVRTLGEHVTLTVVPAARPAVVRIDPVQFDLIALNLAVNARDAMPNGGRLRIALEHAPQSSTEPAEQGWVHLKVTDSGSGMDERTQARIFEPFFTTKEKGKGTGLGLATCFGIVADAGGKICVESAPGQGSTFTVEFPPFLGEADSAVGESGAVARGGRAETVLVAEDDEALRRVASRVLESAGYTVHVAADGNEAKKKVDELGSRLDVLVTDVVMPGCSGYDVAEHARRVAPRAAILLTSGFMEEVARPNPRDDLPLLWKPVPPQDLVRAVSEALRARPASRTEPSSGYEVEDDEAASKAREGVVQPPHMLEVLVGVEQQPVGATVPTRSARVLVVDDEPWIGIAVRRVLQDHEVTVLTRAQDAVDLLAAGNEFDVILSDLMMPGMSGMDFYGVLARQHPEMASRIVFVTGGSFTPESSHFLETIANERLEKPIDLRQLRELVQRFVK